MSSASSPPVIRWCGTCAVRCCCGGEAAPRRASICGGSAGDKGCQRDCLPMGFSWPEPSMPCASWSTMCSALKHSGHSAERWDHSTMHWMWNCRVGKGRPALSPRARTRDSKERLTMWPHSVSMPGSSETNGSRQMEQTSGSRSCVVESGEDRWQSWFGGQEPPTPHLHQCQRQYPLRSRRTPRRGTRQEALARMGSVWAERTIPQNFFAAADRARAIIPGRCRRQYACKFDGRVRLGCGGAEADHGGIMRRRLQLRLSLRRQGSDTVLRINILDK